MKKYIIMVLVASLLFSAIIGIWSLLIGKFDELQIKILFTTLSFMVYSIIGLCCNSIIGSKYSAIGAIGLGITVCGLSYAVFTTWATPMVENFIQFRLNMIVVGFCFAHLCLMLGIQDKNAATSVVKFISIIATILATVIVVSMISSLNADASMFKLLGVVLIVGVTATIITPLLSLQKK